jgi:hypothetical protein
MPRRSNLFQDIVGIIHRQMAGEAKVEESAMLLDRMTGQDREVDVVILGRTGGHDITVAVEATSTGRKASTPWVEAMVEKHRNLPTDKLVLVSEAGFTDPARKKAEQEYAVALTPEDLGGDDPVGQVVNRLKSVWPKLVNLTPERARVWVRRPDDSEVWFKAPADLFLFAEDGQLLTTLLEFTQYAVMRSWPSLMKDLDLANIAEDTDKKMYLLIERPRLILDGRKVSLHARDESQGSAPELHQIERIVVEGRVQIEVKRIDLRHARLGEVLFAHGETTIGRRSALLVATEHEEGGAMSIRFRDPRPN